MTCEQESYIQKFKSISLSMDDVLDRLRVPRRRLHPDETGGAVVGRERLTSGNNRGKWVDYVLIDRIRVKSEQECWEWTGPKHEFGYGQICIGDYGKVSRPLSLQKIVWSILFGQVPKGLIIRHKCDNPPCCNPFHLEPGTQMDNMHDKIRRGRANWALGEKQGTAKLKAHQIPEIRALAASGMTQRALAKQYNIGLTCINHIIHRKLWAWVK